MYTGAASVIPTAIMRVIICMIQGYHTTALQEQIVPVEKKSRAGAATPDAAQKKMFMFSITESEGKSNAF